MKFDKSLQVQPMVQLRLTCENNQNFAVRARREKKLLWQEVLIFAFFIEKNKTLDVALNLYGFGLCFLFCFPLSITCFSCQSITRGANKQIKTLLHAKSCVT